MKYRIPHKLRSNKITYLPKKFLFFDTETYRVKKNSKTQIHKLKLGWSCYWQRTSGTIPEFTKWLEFKDSSTFWEFIEDQIYRKERLVIVSHNIVFDFTIVDGWTELINRGWRLTRLYEKGRTFIATYKKTEKTILLLDNMNFFMTSLANLGKQLGIEKLNIDFSKCTNEHLSKYCKQDVKIILDTWKQYLDWFKSNDLGNFGVTISGQAFNTYRHRFMKKDIYIHNRKYVLNLERDSYFGGRTECFKIGSFTSDNYYYLDINSMYPSVMKYNYFPVKYKYYDLKVTPAKLDLYLKKYCLVSRVEVNTDKPIIPFRYTPVDLSKYDKQIYREWNNFNKTQTQQLFDSYTSEFANCDVYKALKVFVKRHGGVKPINKKGESADVLASSLMYENPDLARVIGLKEDNYKNGDKLLNAIKNNKKYVDITPDENTYNEMLQQLIDRDKIKHIDTGKVVFPTGKFITALTTPELELAVKNNAITKILSVAVYDRAKIFEDFIDFFYNQRLRAKADNNKAYELFFKLIMNSLYGKFGQRVGEWVTVGKCDPKEVGYWTEIIKDKPELYHFRKINGLIQRYDKPSESFNSFPAISAHVTAYARVKLYNLMDIANFDNVYYCDTDSIFVNSKGYSNLKLNIDPNLLGMLKVENVTQDIKILGCKQYIFGSLDKHKGLKKDAVKIDDKTFSQSQWSTLKTLIISGNVNDYQVTDVIKRFTGNYDKGIIQPDGRVKPLVL